MRVIKYTVVLSQRAIYVCMYMFIRYSFNEYLLEIHYIIHYTFIKYSLNSVYVNIYSYINHYIFIK